MMIMVIELVTQYEKCAANEIITVSNFIGNGNVIFMAFVPSLCENNHI